MKHALIGGDGFVGRHLAVDLHSRSEEVLVADLQQGAQDICRHVPFLKLDVTKPEQLRVIDLKPDDIVYNLSVRMLSPTMPRCKRRAFFCPVDYDGVEKILQFMEEKMCTRLIQYATDMVYGHSKSVPQFRERGKPGNCACRVGNGPRGANEAAAPWRPTMD